MLKEGLLKEGLKDPTELTVIDETISLLKQNYNKVQASLAEASTVKIGCMRMEIDDEKRKGKGKLLSRFYGVFVDIIKPYFRLCLLILFKLDTELHFRHSTFTLVDVKIGRSVKSRTSLQFIQFWKSTEQSRQLEVRF